MKWEFVSLREVVEFKGGGTPRKDVPEFWNGDIPWATVKDFKSLELKMTEDSISEHGLKQSASNLISAGHVIIPTRMGLGKAAINSIDLAINQDLRALIPIRDLDPRYLLHCMIGLGPEIERNGSGATVKGITQEKLYNLKIPLPPLEEQKRIAKILDAAYALRAKRRQAIAQLDTFLQSTFFDLFGDPVTNPKGWEVCSLQDHGSFKNGINFGNGESGYAVNCIGVGDFQKHSTLKGVKSLTKVDLNQLPSDEYFLRDGDLLLVRSNGNKKLVGRCIAVYPGNARIVYSGFCIRYRLNKGTLLPSYLIHLFRNSSFRSLLLSGGQGANIQNINQKILSGVKILQPPLELQHHFASIVESVEQQKSRMQAQLTQFDTLFASLQQRAFKGEL